MIFAFSLFFSFLFFILLVFTLKVLLKGRKKVSNRIRLYSGYRTTEVVEGSVVSGLRKKVHNLFLEQAKSAENKGDYSRWDLLMIRADFPLLGTEFLAISGIGEFLVFLIVSAAAHNLLAGAGAAALLGGIGYFYINYRSRKRLDSFQKQLSDCLTLVANSLRAGFSFLQTMEIVSREMDPPMSREFERVMRDTRLGKTMEDALRNMDARVGSPDFSLVVTAVLIQQQIGGNLASVLDTIRDTIIERVRIRREISTLTAQGRASGVILTCIPVVLSVLFYIISPEYMAPLLHTDIGHMLIGIAVAAVIIGFIIIRKIVDIKV